MQLIQPVHLQPLAAVATVAGVVLAAVSRLQGPVAVGALVLFCLGLSVVDGIGKQRFSLRQAVVFLGTVGLGLLAWGLVALFLLTAVDLPADDGVRAVLIGGGTAVGAALVAWAVKVAVAHRVIEPLLVRRGLKGPGPRGADRATGFERHAKSRARERASATRGAGTAGAPAGAQPAGVVRGD